MTGHVIKILAHADGRAALDPHCYVSRYDPDAFDGAGQVETVRDPREARIYSTFASAMTAWRQQAAQPHAYRSDGQPNRPMTAFTVTVLKIATAIHDYEQTGVQ